MALVEGEDPRGPEPGGQDHQRGIGDPDLEIAVRPGKISS
jgi:hypothetical protein